MSSRPTPVLEVKLEVVARLLYAKGSTSGKMNMCYTGARVLEEGVEVGSISPTVGASLQVTDRNGNTWEIGPEGVWEAFEKLNWKLPED